MRIIPSVIAICLLPACAATSIDSPPVAGGSGGTCSADKLGGYVGQKATAALGAELLAKSGARTLRWAPPRSAMTMDYREDRLTVTYNDDMIIESASCG